jgi:hypothetical protein
MAPPWVPPPSYLPSFSSSSSSSIFFFFPSPPHSSIYPCHFPLPPSPLHSSLSSSHFTSSPSPPRSPLPLLFIPTQGAYAVLLEDDSEIIKEFYEQVSDTPCPLLSCHTTPTLHTLFVTLALYHTPFLPANHPHDDAIFIQSASCMSPSPSQHLS